ncbi:MAG: FmdB family zinc ribbon protein [Myxococcaceae bacterium]
MPIYEYLCERCGKTTDVLQKMDDPPPEACELCGAKGALSKAVSRASFVLKGGGWYSDLYSSKKPGGSAKEGSGEKSEASSASKPAAKADANPGAKSEAKSETKSETKSASATPAAPSTPKPTPSSK